MPNGLFTSGLCRRIAPRTMPTPSSSVSEAYSLQSVGAIMSVETNGRWTLVTRTPSARLSIPAMRSTASMAAFDPT
ncbi:Uncharacterised protein [Mycobacteroides abscessus subsp. abscessus]|nr:Uncharacterised protein [Mycobacteroides abscessus subsp. abscessus]